MIRTISDILKGFIDAERKKIDKFELKHGPTIGKMYEGLASKVLERAIPENLNLNIVSGFIYDDIGNMTGEIDCMLVRDKGIQIPHTACYKWHIKDVIAVFEIKKNLYRSELHDAFIHLRKVSQNYSKYIKSGQSSETFDITSAIKAFSGITSVIPPSRNRIEELDYHLEMIYHTLIVCDRKKSNKIS